MGRGLSLFRARNEGERRPDLRVRLYPSSIILRGRSGFTLLELLTAIAIMSVGTFVIVSLFASSITLADINRSRKVAAALAEEQLASLTTKPEIYVWPDLRSLEPGDLAEVRLQGTEPGVPNPVTPPSALPPARAAQDREMNFYDGFSWQAFARLPSRDAGYVEVTVVVRWVCQGREDLITLTSSVPRAQVEGTA